MALERKEYVIAPTGPNYSRAVKAGNTLYISGCTARGTDAQGKSMMEQLEVTLNRLVSIAAEEGVGPGNFAKLTCFVTSMADYKADPQQMEALFAKYFEGQYPANSLVEITALAEPGLDVEIEAVVILE